MSDYARAGGGGSTHFTDKDELDTGNINKKIVGSQFDAEFNAILTAVNSKTGLIDDGDGASSEEAVAETSNQKIITPLSLGYWSDGNSGMVGDMQDTADPGAHGVWGWDDTANVGKMFANATNGGIAFAAGTIAIDLNDLGIETGIAAGDFIPMEDITDNGSEKITFANFEAALAIANFVDYDANKYVDHTAVSVIAGDGLTGGGTIAADTTLNVVGTAPIVDTADAVTFNMSGLTTIQGNALATADLFLVDDGAGGTNKTIAYGEMGLISQTGEAGATDLALEDVNTMMEFTATGTLTIKPSGTTAYPVGGAVLLNNKHATQVLTVTADTGVTLVSVYHPAGDLTGSDTLLPGGSAVLYLAATDVWKLSGDIED